ncbi:hypothetical protein KP509_02G075900 [Ceratopteris richardii]|uniref:Uncharacterized protein n=1 Tax=Ceratopteris richardii TaxID=49495 RepID=A0A8T2VIS9_CERRI|nr:hypothetical protein KP509_02G075900 [Ceratopteris richardii]
MFYHWSTCIWSRTLAGSRTSARGSQGSSRNLQDYSISSKWPYEECLDLREDSRGAKGKGYLRLGGEWKVANWDLSFGIKSLRERGESLWRKGHFTIFFKDFRGKLLEQFACEFRECVCCRRAPRDLCRLKSGASKGIQKEAFISHLCVHAAHPSGMSSSHRLSRTENRTRAHVRWRSQRAFNCSLSPQET